MTAFAAAAEFSTIEGRDSASAISACRLAASLT